MNHHDPPCKGGPDCNCGELDELIAEAIAEDETPLSNCCGSPFLTDTDICSDCREHASAEIHGFKSEDGEREFVITYDPETRELISFETVAHATGRRD